MTNDPSQIQKKGGVIQSRRLADRPTRLPVLLLITIAFTAFMTYESLRLECSPASAELLPYRHPFYAVHQNIPRSSAGRTTSRSCSR